MDIAKTLEGLGYKTIPNDFYTFISGWKSWHAGNVASFHNYKVRNSGKVIKCRRYSLGMAKKLTEDVANLLMNEKVKITIEGDNESEFIGDIFDKNNFWVKINEMQEMKAATGTTAYIPRVTGAQITAEGTIVGAADGIAIDYVTAEHIHPLSWANGVINECAFDAVVTVDGEQYCYLQIHRYDEKGEYVIENHIYLIGNDNLHEVALTDVKGYERIPAVVYTRSSNRQFVIDRLNIANNLNYSLPMGISIYANAVDILKGVDIAYDSYVNEFVLGKKRIMVKPSATQYLDGEPIFDSDDLVFYVLPEDMGDNSVIHEIDMKLRTAEHNTGIQDQLNLLSSKCGFGENHYRFDNGSVSTATQIVSENSSLFRSIKKHEIILESVLDELCRILLRLGNSAMSKGFDEAVEINISFDDSIIEDKQSEFVRDMQLLASGVINDWEMRVKYLGEDEETAKAMLPSMEALAEPIQEEVE